MKGEGYQVLRSSMGKRKSTEKLKAGHCGRLQEHCEMKRWKLGGAVEPHEPELSSRALGLPAGCLGLGEGQSRNGLHVEDSAKPQVRLPLPCQRVSVHMERSGRSLRKHSTKDMRWVFKETQNSLSWLPVWEFPVWDRVGPRLWASGGHAEWHDL